MEHTIVGLKWRRTLGKWRDVSRCVGDEIIVGQISVGMLEMKPRLVHRAVGGLASGVIRGPNPDLTTQPQSSTVDSSKPAMEYQSWATVWVHRHQRVSTSDRNTLNRPDQTSQTSIGILIRSAARPQPFRWTELSSWAKDYLRYQHLSNQVFSGSSSNSFHAETSSKRRLLTISDLEQSLSDDTASDVEGLAAVVPDIWAFSISDGQIPCLGYREAAGRLRRLVGEEQVLWGMKSYTKIRLWLDLVHWKG